MILVVTKRRHFDGCARQLHLVSAHTIKLKVEFFNVRKLLHLLGYCNPSRFQTSEDHQYLPHLPDRGGNECVYFTIGRLVGKLYDDFHDTCYGLHIHIPVPKTIGKAQR